MGMGVPKFGGSPKFCDTGTRDVYIRQRGFAMILQ